MRAWINNYSAPTQSISALTASAFKSYCITERNPSNASVVLTDPSELSLNSKIIFLLNEFLSLRQNWDEDDAAAPSAVAVKSAKVITDILSKHAQPIFHTAPGPQGEIMLDIRNKSKSSSLEIIIYPDKAIAVFFPADGAPSQEKFDIDNLPDLLKQLNQK